MRKQNNYMKMLDGQSQAQEFKNFIKDENDVVGLEAAQLKYFLNKDNEPNGLPKYGKSCTSNNECLMIGPGNVKMDYGSCTEGSCNMTNDMSQGFSGAGSVRSTTSLNADFFRGDPLIQSPPLSINMFRTSDSYELNLFRPSKLLYSTVDK